MSWSKLKLEFAFPLLLWYQNGIIHFLPVKMFPMLYFPYNNALTFINFLKEWNVCFLPAFGIS